MVRKTKPEVCARCGTQARHLVTCVGGNYDGEKLCSRCLEIVKRERKVYQPSEYK